MFSPRHKITFKAAYNQADGCPARAGNAYLDNLEGLCYIGAMSLERLSAKDLQGVWTALVTPFERGGVNTAKMSELVRLARDAGLTGVVPLGSTGESAALTDKEHETVISSVVEATGGRLPVMVGAGTNNTPKTLGNVRRAADLGANAVLVVAPYYNKPTPAGLKRHFTKVAESSPLPIILYNIPSRCGVGIPAELVLELAQHPMVIGVKEAGGDVWRSAEIARLAPRDFAVLSGDDPLTLPLLAVGAVGVISVVSNIAPRLTRRMVDDYLKGDPKGALKIHRRLAPLIKALGLETNPAPIKEAMNLSGIGVGPVRSPLAPVTAATRRAIRQALEQAGKLE